MDEQDYRAEFQARFGYSHSMAELDKQIPVDECWGNAMSYQRLLELADEHGDLHVSSVIYHAGRVYYGDFDKPPHPLNQDIVPSDYKKYRRAWGERTTYIIRFASYKKDPPFPQCRVHNKEITWPYFNETRTRTETFYTLDLWDVQLKPFFDLCANKFSNASGVLYRPIGQWGENIYPVLIIADDYLD
jgi:hypothetical protein